MIVRFLGVDSGYWLLFMLNILNGVYVVGKLWLRFSLCLSIVVVYWILF